MSGTDTYTPTARDELNSGNIGAVARALQALKAGNMASKIKVVATSLTGAASFDITTAAFLAKCTVTGITLKTGETLPPVGQVVALRKVTASQAAICVMTDKDATATAGSATLPAFTTLSDDGKTIGFETSANVTAFTLEYYPAPAAGTVIDSGP